MQISVIESDLKCGVCAHMRSATSAAEDHGRCICALIAPLQEEHDLLLDGYLMIIINISP
jgi:hypothetical protein